MFRKRIIGGTIHFVAWLLFFTLSIWLFQQSESRVAYGFISAWWACLFFDFFFRVDLAAFPVIVLYSFVLVAGGDFLFPNLIYHDLPPVLSRDFWFFAYPGFSLGFVSSFLVSLVFGWISRRFAGR